MSKYDRLLGEERKSQKGYINPLNEEFTTHEEVTAHLAVLKELRAGNFPDPASRQVVHEAQRTFTIKVREAVTKKTILHDKINLSQVLQLLRSFSHTSPYSKNQYAGIF